MKEIILQKSNFRCRENIYICRPLRRLRRLAVEYVKNRARFKRKSGGIACIVNKQILHCVEYMNTKSQYALWLKITDNKRVNEHVYIGIVYIPPENSLMNVLMKLKMMLIIS